MPERKPSSWWIWGQLAALVILAVMALIRAISGDYWFALVEISVALMLAVLLGGAGKKGGVLYALFWASLGLAILALTVLTFN